MTRNWTQAQNEDRGEVIERLRNRGTEVNIGAHYIPGTIDWSLLDNLGFVVQALEPRVGHRAAVKAVMSVLRAGDLT